MLHGNVLAASLVLGAGAAELYCPSQNDFNIEGGHWNGNGGWTMTGGGGAHGKQTFNLLGGYVEFDIDTAHAHTGVNNNFYLVSPKPSYFQASNDCDIQCVGKPCCMEMDIIENNGNCLAQTTWHTWANHNGGCDQGGCWGQTYRSGTSRMKATFSTGGWMDVYIDGSKVDVSHPVPSQASVDYVRTTMATLGAQIQSSQWVGWVPSGNCQGGGGLDSSTFSITNIRVFGSVVQGPHPPHCSGPAPSPTPSPTPTPPPPPPAGHGSCRWGSCGGNVMAGWCSESQEHCSHCGGSQAHWCSSYAQNLTSRFGGANDTLGEKVEVVV